MRTQEEINKVLELYKTNKNFCDISRKLNIPRGTIRAWIKSSRKQKM